MVDAINYVRWNDFDLYGPQLKSTWQPLVSQSIFYLVSGSFHDSDVIVGGKCYCLETDWSSCWMQCHHEKWWGNSFFSTTAAFSDFGGVAALFATEQDANCHELSSDRRTSMFCRSERLPLGPARWSSGLETGGLWFRSLPGSNQRLWKRSPLPSCLALTQYYWLDYPMVPGCFLVPKGIMNKMQRNDFTNHKDFNLKS